MATYSKFNSFVQDIGRAVMNLNTDTLKLLLTDTLPVATNSVLANITQIAAGNGYTLNGLTIASTSYAQSGGVASMNGANVTITASGGAIAQWRYAAWYDSTASGGPLIGWADSGAEQNIASGNSVIVQWNSNASTVIFTVT